MADNIPSDISYKIDNISTKINQQNAKLKKIESILIDNAIQNTKITEMQCQINSLWVKYDYNFGPQGVVSKISMHQAKCPRDQLSRLWWAVGIMTTAYLAAISFIVDHLGGNKIP